MSITELSKDIPSIVLTNRKSKFNCPVCKLHMNEYVFKAPDNTLVDRCIDGHGVYLESGELIRIFKTIKNLLFQ